MCGRFAIKSSLQTLKKEFSINNISTNKLLTNYNISPGSEIPIVFYNQNIVLDNAKWGLIPIWTKDKKKFIINAKSETINEKISFKQAFRERRCIIPASGFYEWKKIDNQKVPFYFFLKDIEIFGIAGIFNIHTDPSGEYYKSFSLITTSANSLVEKIHNRMPVILKKGNYLNWVKEIDIDLLKKNFIPFNSNKMDLIKVSKFVNNPKNNSEECIKPI